MKRLQNLTFDYEPVENPDWGFARTNRFVLRNSMVEFGLSAYSVPIELSFPSKELHLTAPNRDYPYEGLLALTGGENWKFLDCFAFGILRKGVALKLHSKKVSASTWLLDYLYDIKNGQDYLGLLQASYWLSEDGGHACLNLGIKTDSPEGDLELIVAPFLDIRHVYSESEPERHIIEITKDRDGCPAIYAEKDGRSIVISTSYREARIDKGNALLNWFYKLGEGFRVQTSKGIFFSGRYRTLSIPGYFGIKIQNGTWIEFHALPMIRGDSLKMAPMGGFKEILEYESKKASSVKRKIKNRWADDQIYRSVLSRIDALTRFGMKIDRSSGRRLVVPEAGGWWFRTVWMRDVYTGLLQNLNLLRILDKRLEIVKDSILLGIEYFDITSGRVPNYLPMLNSDYEKRNNDLLPLERYYFASDATLLFFIAFWRYLELTREKNLVRIILRLFKRAFQVYQKASLDAVNGPPVIMDSGLLACVPWHSWIDSKRMIAHKGLKFDELPTRLPKEWLMEEIESSRDPGEVKRIFNTPRFYLPEINALWIETLDAIAKMAKVDNSAINSELLELIEDLSLRAKANYLKVFWNDQDEYFYDVLFYDLSRRDRTLGSPSLMAASILKGNIPKERAESLWKVAQKKLLVHRRVRWLERYHGESYPFGVIVKDREERAYFGDEQYHGAVVWPRDTPYLIGLLERIERYDVIKGLLISNLDHQMGEGAIFYNHELFSLPQGNNPSPIKESKEDPVPVKNPTQFWSQWTDPYLKHKI
ncbi:MAG: amylo-alpha-1,6-glucosidase [Nitrososphaerales archaeon]